VIATECKQAVVDVHYARLIQGGVELDMSVKHYFFDCHYKALVFVANYNAKHGKHGNSLAQFGGFYSSFPSNHPIETEIPDGYL